MRFRHLAAVVAAATLLPALAVTSGSAEAAPWAAVRVTLSALPTSADVGQKVLVAGTATPARKRGKKVPVAITVQRRYGAGAWQTVTRSRTTRAGRYAVRVPLVQGGPTSFRVLRAGRGASPARSLAVYAWLDLVDQPLVFGANAVETRRTLTIGGRSFPHSLTFLNGGALELKPNGLCTTFDAWTGFLDSEAAAQGSTARQSGTINADGGSSTSYSVPVGPAQHLTVDLTGRPYVFALIDLDNEAPSTRAVLASPRVRCNATSLPELRYDEIPV